MLRGCIFIYLKSVLVNRKYIVMNDYMQLAGYQLINVQLQEVVVAQTDVLQG